MGLVHAGVARASLGHRRNRQRSCCCCVRKMADRFSRFNEERDFQVIAVRGAAVLTCVSVVHTGRGEIKLPTTKDCNKLCAGSF